MTSYTYNPAGQLTSVANPAGQVESYTYNSAGQEIKRTQPDGSVTNYAYNANGQLSSLTDGSGNLITQYTYNIAGQLSSTVDGNGQITNYTYDANGNVTQIQTKTAAGTVTSQLNYTYDAAGHPVTATSLDGGWTYTYNANGELTHAVFASTNASIANQDLTYKYDAAGNRTQTIFNGAVDNYTTNGLNQYTSSNGTTYSYDADGNLVQMVQNGQTTTYTYNSQNQLISTTGPSGATTYTYDALGNVVSTSVNGVVSNYIIDPLAVSTSATGPLSAIAQVYNASGQVTATYDYGKGLTAQISSAGTNYYNADETGNIVSLSGTNGALADTYAYDPFGNLLASSGGVSNPFQYSGSFGITTGVNSLVDMRARYYDPATGRFITQDPTGIAGGTNLYEYALNGPTQFVDPTGTSLTPLQVLSLVAGTAALFAPPLGALWLGAISIGSAIADAQVGSGDINPVIWQSPRETPSPTGNGLPESPSSLPGGMGNGLPGNPTVPPANPRIPKAPTTAHRTTQTHALKATFT